MERFPAGNHEPRAGEVAGGLLEASRGVERFDAINASTLRSDFLGHSYYANHGSMLGDIYCLLKGIPATGRPLLVLAGAAWQFRPPDELDRLDVGACRAAIAARLPISAPGPASPAFHWLPVGAGVLGAALLVVAVLFLRRRAL